MLSISVRFSCLWNACNSNPNASFGTDATSTQAGQALHGNFAVQYEIRHGLVAGLSGYWLRQISDTKVNGTNTPGRREQVVGVSPAAMVALSPKDFLLFNCYREFVRNRAEGRQVPVATTTNSERLSSSRRRTAARSKYGGEVGRRCSRWLGRVDL